VLSSCNLRSRSTRVLASRHEARLLSLTGRIKIAPNARRTINRGVKTVCDVTCAVEFFPDVHDKEYPILASLRLTKIRIAFSRKTSINSARKNVHRSYTYRKGTTAICIVFFVPFAIIMPIIVQDCALALGASVKQSKIRKATNNFSYCRLYILAFIKRLYFLLSVSYVLKKYIYIC